MKRPILKARMVGELPSIERRETPMRRVRSPIWARLGLLYTIGLYAYLVIATIARH